MPTQQEFDRCFLEILSSYDEIVDVENNGVLYRFYKNGVCLFSFRPNDRHFYDKEGLINIVRHKFGNFDSSSLHHLMKNVVDNVLDIPDYDIR